ncbi:uncharacterized protein LOC143633005 [Bidens hawaiensis]|uniref:uncharacterized protein LOC143633005 n=1 Tax=Bidens hawaiensis TaxID=980011 RepID=UPI00404A3583
MPKSSRSKSHKQSKHSSKEYYSGSDEDVKPKDRSINGGKEDARVSVRVSKDNKYGNGGSDRWSSDDKGLVINVDDNNNNINKEEVVVVKLKSGGESKSKSRKHDGESERLTGEKRKSEDGKRKSEKESGRKDKEYKESKERERGSEKRKGHGDKYEAEGSVKQGESQSSKKGKEITEWSIEEELRNPELEKELEKRMRRRGEASSVKDKYQDDTKETEDRYLSTRNDRSKDERHKNEEYGDIKESRKKDEKHREDGDHDRKSRDVKHRGESGRYSKHKDDKYYEDKYSEDGNKETKYKEDKYMDTSDKDERSRDRKRRQDDDRDYKHKEEKRARDSKRSRDDSDRKANNRDGSPVYDDRAARYKDDKDRKRGYEKNESSHYRSRSSIKERPESEKRLSAKAESASEWGRSSSRYADVEIASNHSRRRSSPSSTRDHHRVSKQEETKYQDYYEDRSRHNAHSSKDYDSAPGQSDKKVTLKDDGYVGGDLSGEKRARPESPSSTSNERRNLIKTDARKSLDLEEPGPRTGGSKDNVKDGKGSRELVNEVDNDNLSVSSPYMKNSHYSGNTKSHLPPPSPSPSPSMFEDDRSKSNNRHRRMVDPNMNRGQSQSQGNWNNNVSNWPSPMVTGGYIPFQHVPPPMFHPLMPQFPPQIFGRPPMNVNPGLPYHAPDHSRPPSLHGWDANNAVFGDESHLYGRLDWDHRSQMSNRGWDQSGTDVHSGHRHDENWTGPTGQPDEGEQNQPDNLPETLNLDKNEPATQKVTESPQIFEAVKEINSAIISAVYLSKVDVSKDLTQPELYEECSNMIDLDPEASLSDEFDCKILFLEEGADVDVIDSASLFSVTNDSVFQKAMLLYKKQKEEFDLTETDKEKGGSDDDKSADEVAAEVDHEDSKENDEPLNKPEEPTNMEVDHDVLKQEEEDEAVKQEEEDEAVKQEEEDDDKSGSDEKNGGGGVVSTADVAVTPTESVEFGSVNLNRIHHHSPESTH